MEAVHAPQAGALRHDLAPQRVRFTPRLRVLEVRGVERVTPHLVRVTLHGPELQGFESAGFDDHVKLFFPDEATGELPVPVNGPEGPAWPGGVRPVMRDYTPRRFDLAALTLEIDFALHVAGPATRWAEQARPGQRLGVGGPRGSFVVPTAYDWHLLVGDDTALPAIARRLAELPAGTNVQVLAEVDGPRDRIELPTAAAAQVTWVYREGADDASTALLEALRRLSMPAGTFHGWIACESAQAKALRAFLVDECLANPKWIRASGYWRRGSAATHDKIE